MSTSVEIASLNHYYKNAKRGNIPKLKKSLEKFGQYQEIVVNEGTLTGRPREILVGNNVTKAARELGWTHLDARIIDVDDTRAAEIVAVDNKLSDDGEYDKGALAELMSLIPTPEDVGFSAAEMDELQRSVAAGAASLLAEFSSSLQAEQEAQARTQPLAPPATAAPVAFSNQDSPQAAPASEAAPTSGPGEAARSNTVPAAEVARDVEPPVDSTPYFTLSYTVTGPERDVIHAAIRKIQAEDPELKGAQALTELCRRFSA